MTEAAPAPARRRAPRWLWIGFFVSLALNLLIVGIAIGAAWHFKTGKMMQERGAPRHFGAFLHRLPRERRREFRAMFREEQPGLRRFRDDVRTARQAAERALAAEPFDRAGFADANRRLHDARARLRGAQGELFPRIAEKMTAEERRMFLEWRKSHWKRWRKWRREREER